MIDKKDTASFRGTVGHVIPIDTKALADDGTFEGYASTYGNVDLGDDVIMAGAFDDSLRVRPAPKIKMLLHHNTEQIVGMWQDAQSDARGLRVKGKLILKTALGRDTYELMKAGALDAMSIGYRVMLDEMDRASGVRSIIKADLREVSLVTFGMNEMATITGVKAAHAIDAIETLSDAEKLLREADGFSRKEALDFVSRVKRIAQREAGADQGEAIALYQLAAKLRR